MAREFDANEVAAEMHAAREALDDVAARAVEEYRGMPDIERALAEGEGAEVEFKRAMPPQTRDLAKEVAAMASTNGGLILLGVTDDGDVIGCDVTIERVEGIIKSVEPTPSAGVKAITRAGSRVIVISVKAGMEPIHYVQGRPYVRDGSLSRPAKPDEVIRRVLSSNDRRGSVARLQEFESWKRVDDDLGAYISRGQRLIEQQGSRGGEVFYELTRTWWNEAYEFLKHAFGLSVASSFHVAGANQAPTGQGDLRDWIIQLTNKITYLIQVSRDHQARRPGG